MKNIRKRYLIPLIILVIVAAFATFVGCGKNDNNDNDDSGNSSLLRYSITIMDGDSVYGKEYLYVDSGNVFTVPKKNGNKFLGYYTADGVCFFDGTGNQTELLINKDLTLYCHWEVLDCTITFNPDGGYLATNEQTDTYTYGSQVNLFPVPEKVGYDFVGWLDGDKLVTDGFGYVLADYVKFNDDNYTFKTTTTVELKASYSLKKVYINLNYNDYSISPEQVTAYYGDNIAEIELPVKDTGTKIVSKWSTDPYTYVMPTGNLTEDIMLYAIWREYRSVNIYITSTQKEVVKVFKDEVYTTKSERKGYTFKGWYTNSALTGLATNSISYDSGISDYYCAWTIVDYSVTLYNKYGIMLRTISYNIESDIDLPVLESENGFEFLGWCSKSDLSDTPITNLLGVCEVTKLYPKWRDYTTLNVHYPDNQVKTVVVKYNSDFSIDIPTTEYKEKGFAYWYVKDGETKVPITDKTGAGLEKWSIKNASIDVYSEYKQYATITTVCEYPDKTTENMGSSKYFIGETITLTNPQKNYFVKGYYVNNVLYSSEQTASFVVPSGNTTITIKLTTVSNEYSNRFGYNIYAYNGHYYSVVKKTMASWQAAEDFCEFYGGHLVTITSSNEQSKLVSIMRAEAPNSYNFWLGASDAQTEGVWQWVTGEVFDYKNWGYGEPSGGSRENYLQFFSGYTDYRWNDAGNNGSCYAICEWDNISNLNLPNIVKLSFNDGTENNATKIFSYNGSKYALFDKVMTWTEAEKFCEYIGGHLVVITSSEENNYIYKLNEYVGGGANRWMGGSDYKTEGTFKYVTGEIMSYTNWNSSEPNNYNNQDYMCFYGSAGSSAAGKWDDNAVSNTSIKFICEWNSGETPGQIKYGNYYKKIASADDLVNYNSAATNWGGVGDVLLTKDIDMSGISWSIGDFAGTFDGDNHKISNLSIINNTAYTGMFATVTGTIKNVKFESLTLNSNYKNSSSYCGVVAYLNGGTVDGVEVLSGYIYSNWAETGGIVGCASKNAVVKNCKNHASVTSSNTANSYDNAGTTGGIVGWALTGATITNSHNYGAISGTYEVGGIVGGSEGAITLTKMSNAGDVNGTAYVGGLLGCGRKAVTIDGCTFSGNVTAKKNYGKYVGTTDVTYKNLAKIYINEVADLDKIKLNVTGETISLKANLDLSGYTWTTFDMAATFDGGDYTLSNISIIAEAAKVGVFGTVKGTVQNVTFENVNIISAYGNKESQCGIIAYLDGGIANKITVSGSIQANWARTGGIVGQATNSATITNCINRASVTVDNAASSISDPGLVGGILGWAQSAIKLEKCENHGAVTGTYEVGGIIGRSDANLVLKGLVNEGRITGKSYVGGIVGNVNTQSVTIDGCTSTGIVTADSKYSKYVGSGSATYANLPAIKISNKEELTLLIGNVSAESFTLTSDIDMFGEDWKTIDLNCTLDGGGYTISNITVSGTDAKVGVFGNVTGTLKNIKFENLNIDTSSNNSTLHCGAVAYLDGGKLYGVSVLSGSIKAAIACTGGVVGTAAAGSSISNCENAAKITVVNTSTTTSDPGATGGVVGWISGAITFANCTNTGDITGTYEVGGVIGACSANLTAQSISNSGTITGTAYVGGLIGNVFSSYTVTINGCTSSGAVSAKSNFSKYVGAGNATYGSLATVYVSKKEDLLLLNGNVAEEQYVLTADINMAGEKWNPIDIKCTLDGAGHTISNIIVSGTVENVGVFGTVTGTIKNLNFENVSITANSNGILGTCGLVVHLNGGTLSYVNVSGEINTNATSMGAIVGLASNGATINNCTNQATVNNTLGGGTAGGIVGMISGTVIVSRCKNYSAVTADSGAGGIVGYCNSNLTLSYLENYGPVTSNTYSGGIVGIVDDNYTVSIVGCISNGRVTSADVYGKYVGSGVATYTSLPTIEISSANDLYLLIGNVAADSFLLTAPIDMSGVSWNPIPLNATFDGQNKTISSFSVSGSSDKVGMFTTVTGTLKNVAFTNVQIISNCGNKESYCGLIAYLDGGVVDNVTVSGRVEATWAYTGAIVGGAKNGAQITNCSSTASVKVINSAESANAFGASAGIVGYVNDTVTISNNTNSGAVTGTYKVGGIVGVAEGTSCTITGCVNNGGVTGTSHVGGIMGYATGSLSVRISTCQSKGVVTATENSSKYVGAGNAIYSSIPVIEIASAADLYLLKGNVYAETYKLTGDIDMSGVEWTPIDLAATINGGNFTIKNLTLNAASSDGLAMFKEVSGTISNLNFENASVYNSITGADNPKVAVVCTTLTGKLQNVIVTSGSVTGDLCLAGGLAAYVNGGTVESCTNYATVSTNGSSGGIVGYIKSGSITGCVNRGVVNGGSHTAGIVGYSDKANISSCENYGAITGTSYTAGIVGECIVYSVFSNLSNSGKITATGDYVSGICGKFTHSGTISLTSQYSNMGVVKTNGDYVGGIFGYFISYVNTGNSGGYYTVTLANMSNEGTIGGGNYIGGLIGYIKVYAENSGSYTSTIKLTASVEMKNSGDVTGTDCVGGLVGYGYSNDTSSTLSGISFGTVSGSSNSGYLAGQLENITLS